MPQTNNSNVLSPAVVIGGGLAGVFAGILMAISATFYAGVSGGGASLPMQMIAATYYGPLAFVGGAGVMTIGVFTHLAVSGALGVVFAALTRKVEHSGKSFFAGILFGTAAWAFMTYVTLPVLNDTMRVRVAITPTWWFFLHWIYGGLLGFFTPGMRRAFERSAEKTATHEQQIPGVGSA